MQRTSKKIWLLWLDTLAIVAWGILLLKYWLTGKVNVLLHPGYVWLAVCAGIFLSLIGLVKLLQTLQVTRRGQVETLPILPHTSLFPPGWSSALLLLAALVGLNFTPRAFASDVALNRGVADTLAMTRSQPQAFRGGTRPEDRSVIDWVRTLSVYPEPDAYTGQKANVEGFAIHSSDLPNNYLMITRFVITCCAADVYPVGLPVKLSGDFLGNGKADRSQYPADQWFRVEGEMITETLNDQRQLVIQAKQLTPIPEPKNPYDY